MREYVDGSKNGLLLLDILAAVGGDEAEAGKITRAEAIYPEVRSSILGEEVLSCFCFSASFESDDQCWCEVWKATSRTL